MRMTFKVYFWSGVVLFLVVTAFASWGLLELRSVMQIRRSAYNMQMTLHSMLESLQEADIIYLRARRSAQEAEFKKVVDLVNRAHQKAVVLTKIDVPNELIREQISELEVLIRSKVKTEDEYRVSGDMFAEPVVRKITTTRDNVILTGVVHEKITAVDRLLIDYQRQHLVYVDKYFTISLATIMAGVLCSFGLFLMFANLVSSEIARRSKLEIELRRAQEAAIAASALKSQFLATVSHEVRTPLNGIIGMSELIRAQAQGELQRHAGVIHDSGRSLLRIVNDILDFSRLEANRLQLELQEVPLSGLLEMAAELFSARAQEKRLLLIADYDLALSGHFAVDGERISQVLHNLLGNAIKFTSAGHICLRGEVVEREGSEWRVRFSVEDTGQGIPEHKAGLLFEPFQQAETEHQREGAGLGLSISKRLVEMMGGTIDFYSQGGEGSRFWFELPVRLLSEQKPPRALALEIFAYQLREPLTQALEHYASQLGLRFHRLHHGQQTPQLTEGTLIFCEPSTVKELSADRQRVAVVVDFLGFRPPAAWRSLPLPLTFDRFLKLIDTPAQTEARGATPSPSQALVPRGNGLILLVEDNPTNQILAQTQLEQLGYRVHVAANGVEALEAMQRMNYDLILMDCRMPVMDGFATTKAIRERERKAQAGHIPIIAVTANALEGDRVRCLAAGMDDYMTKPFPLDELNGKIQKWVELERTQIDWRVVRDLANRTSDDVVKRLIASFRNTLTTSLERLGVAQEQQDWKEVSAIAHQLRSSGAAVGALALSHICNQIEDEIEKTDLTQVSRVEQLRAVGQRVLEELSAQTRYG